MKRPITVDIHHHYVPESYVETVRSEPGALGAVLEGDAIRLDWGRSIQDLDAHGNPKRRIREMDEVGIDVAALSPTPTMLGYRQPLEVARRVCALLNDGLAETARAYPDRFVPMGHVPLQDVGAAVAELERCRFPAIQIGSNINGRNFDDPDLLPFFQAAERLGTFIFVHPNSRDIVAPERLRSYHLINLIGNPVDTAVAIASVVFGGVLDACPNLKICFAHGGGVSPFIHGRWAHGQRVRTEGKVRTTTPVSSAWRKLYFDTITHGDEAMRFLISQAGAGQVMLGTDHPADMEDFDQVARIRGLGLSLEEADGIVGGTAAALLGLDA